MSREETVRAFTAQAESFHGAAVTRLPETLDALVELAAPAAGERWLDAACGPGVVSRALAPAAGEVVGIDATQAMLDVAEREAAAAGLGNLRFILGDIERLDFADGTFDGAVCRFALHHLPVPARALAELRRVVRPGGAVVIADHLGDEDPGALAWSQSLERLRDPSHWFSLTEARLRDLGEALGMRLESERVAPVQLDLADWLARGPGTAANEDAIRWALDAPPARGERFRVSEGTLTLQMWLGRWRR